MPLVTVVVAAKDAAQYIGDAVRSVMAQSLSDWELVVVDDGSTDDTGETVERVAAGDSRVEVVSLQESVGSYAAANLGVSYGTGEFIARLDADDMSEPRRLELQVEAIRRCSSAQACAGAWRLMTQSGVVEDRVRLVPSHSNGFLTYSLFLRSGLVHSSLVIRRAAFEELGGYGSLRVSEDYRLWGRIVRRGWLVATDEPVVRWRAHEGQITFQRDRSDPQRHLALADHMTKASGEEWSPGEASDIWSAGKRVDYDLRRAAELIAKWEKAWTRGGVLNSAERRSLARVAVRLRLAHLRNNRPIARQSATAVRFAGPSNAVLRAAVGLS